MKLAMFLKIMKNATLEHLYLREELAATNYAWLVHAQPTIELICAVGTIITISFIVFSYGQKPGWTSDWGQSWAGDLTQIQLGLHTAGSVCIVLAYVLGEGIVRVKNSQYKQIARIFRTFKGRVRGTHWDGDEGTHPTKLKAGQMAAVDATKPTRHTNHSFAFLTPQMQTTMPAQVLEMSPVIPIFDSFFRAGCSGVCYRIPLCSSSFKYNNIRS